MKNKQTININNEDMQMIKYYLDAIHEEIWTLKDFNDTMLNIFEEIENVDANTLEVLRKCKFIDGKINSLIRNKDFLSEKLYINNIIEEE